MKRIIYSVWFDLGVKNFSEYHERLIQNKQEYANHIDVDWLLCDDRDELEYFKKEYCIEDTYVALNNFKLFKFEELTKEYDEVLYLDLDVIVNTKENFFESVDLSNKIFCKTKDDEDWWKYQPTSSGYGYIHTSPAVKYVINTKLCGEKLHIMNTGVLAGSSKVIKKLDFTKYFTEATKLIAETDFGNEWNNLITPNNESILSYALHKSGVKFFWEDEWHEMREDPKPLPVNAKFIHYLNKCFWEFYKDKTYCIYSLYVDIPDDRLDNSGSYPGDTIDKSLRTKMKMNEYYDRLLDNHKRYAETIGAKYIHFKYDEKYEKYKEELQIKYPNMSDYNVVNFYKIWLLDELSKEYDFVLYLDFDVVCKTEANFFESCNLQESIYVFYEDTKRQANREKAHASSINFRSPTAKYWNSQALCIEYGLKPIDDVYNTGIVGASKQQMEKLDYFGDFDELIQTMEDLQEYSMYPPIIQDCFGYDNETVFGFKKVLNDVSTTLITSGGFNNWHCRVTDEFYNKKEEVPNDNFLHFINKKFEWYFD